MSRLPLGPAVRAATDLLAAAGVHSPRNDAELLAAHVLGVERARLLLVDGIDAASLAEFRELVERRARRIPLQHLLGTAPMGTIDVEVGPGVFVPRMETELLYAWALAQLEVAGHEHRPIVVDLCAGSGVLALAIAHARPDATVHAVELEPAALTWTRRNAQSRAAKGDTPISVHAADVTDPALLAELAGRVDLVVANPPYIPAGAELEPEVAQHDPHTALFAGPDGLDVIQAMVPNLARLVRPGGAVGIEHDDSNGAGVAALLLEHGFAEVVEHRDLAGKPRFVVARRCG